MKKTLQQSEQVAHHLGGTGFSEDVKICILQRGWVCIGRFSKSGNHCKLANASIIRVWGTTKGLSELVHGPTKTTVLDKCDGLIEFDWLTAVFCFSVDPSKWPAI